MLKYFFGIDPALIEEIGPNKVKFRQANTVEAIAKLESDLSNISSRLGEVEKRTDKLSAKYLVKNKQFEQASETIARLAKVNRNERETIFKGRV